MKLSKLLWSLGLYLCCYLLVGHFWRIVELIMLGEVRPNYDVDIVVALVFAASIYLNFSLYATYKHMRQVLEKRNIQKDSSELDTQDD